jgi:hypothetical protein
VSKLFEGTLAFEQFLMRVREQNFTETNGVAGTQLGCD